MTAFKSIRKDLHAHPELSGFEHQTAKKIVAYLSHYMPSAIIENVGGAGVLVLFNFEKDGPTVLFRAELDALPIHEVNTFQHRSKHEKISHKCGHDGHATILIALAKKLSENPFSKGKIALLFQPAEEIGTGAKAVLNDSKFKHIHPNYVFALHNLPGYPMHQIVIKEGAFTASVKSVTIKLFGKTSHAAEPEHGINPSLAISEILQLTNALSNENKNTSKFAVVTPVHVLMGSSDFGISAGYAEMRFTIRTWTEDQLNILTQKINSLVVTVAKKHQLKTDVSYSHHFAANTNNSEAVNIIHQSATTEGFTITQKQIPFKWGEDFGLFTHKYKGAMFGLGAGENTPALHNPDYDFPDEIITTGATIMYQIASKILA